MTAKTLRKSPFAPEHPDCGYSHAIWVGPDRDPAAEYSLVSSCGDINTTSTWPSEQAAIKAKADLDETECGGSCTGEHEILHVLYPKEASHA